MTPDKHEIVCDMIHFKDDKKCVYFADHKTMKFQDADFMSDRKWMDYKTIEDIENYFIEKEKLRKENLLRKRTFKTKEREVIDTDFRMLKYSIAKIHILNMWNYCDLFYFINEDKSIELTIKEYIETIPEIYKKEVYLLLTANDKGDEYLKSTKEWNHDVLEDDVSGLFPEHILNGIEYILNSR